MVQEATLDRIIRKLATGRCIVFFVGIATVGLIGGMFAPAILGRFLFAAATMAAGLAIAGFLTSWKKDIAELRAVSRESAHVQKMLGARLDSINGTLELSHFADAEKLPASADESKSINADIKKTGSIFSPSAITASSIIAKPNAHLAGRGAAAQSMSADSPSKLNSILRANVSQKARRVMWVGPLNLERVRENSDWEVTSFGDGLDFGRPDPTATYLVVNLQENEFTKWDNLQSSLNFEKVRGLLDFIRETKRNNTIVVLLRSSSPDHFSYSLEGSADVICDEDLKPIEQSDVESLPLFNFLKHAVGGIY